MHQVFVDERIDPLIDLCLFVTGVDASLDQSGLIAPI
jgi:hypothetical protein